MNRYFKKLAVPYQIWLFALAILPLILMIILSFMDCEGVDFSNVTFTLANFQQFSSKSTIVAFFNSLFYALLTTVICAFLGYIVAYKIFRSHFKNKFLILTLLILPMWSNILLRVNALKNILEPHNIIISLFNKIGINIVGLDLAGKPIAIILGLISTYLPFMILTIYTSLEKIEPSLEEAANDLGLTNFKKFWTVVFPLSTKGIITGSIMVFLPCMSGFAIPEILGQGNIVLIGNIIDQSFRNMNYNVGALISVCLLIIILGCIGIVSKVDKEGETLI
jgi:spermidine/putrescine transport system permease protein